VTKLLFLFLLLSLALLFNPWTPRLYVAEDALKPSDVVVPLRGSPDEEQMRLDGAVRLVREGYAPTLLVSVSSEPVYGRPARSLVEAYLKDEKFPAEKLAFCESDADSTFEEATALRSCLRERGAKKAIIVTSEYHSRRARFLFRRALQGDNIELMLRPMYSQDYWDPHWWQRRRWAKTFLVETFSWAWNLVEQAVR
jgi:uncharacterized SAM-binding protein YcdF (DUF218 family)